MAMPSKTPSWAIEDLIDLEYFLHRDDPLSEYPDTETTHRDERRHYLDAIQPLVQKSAAPQQESGKSIIRHWLEYKRGMEISARPEGSSPLPGELFRQTYAFLVLMFMILGLSSGSGLSFSFLIYKGHAPLNVSAYLGIFVLTQMVLICLVFLFLFLRRCHVEFHQFSLIRAGVAFVITRLILWLKNRSERHLSAEKRISYQSALGVLKGKSRHYRNLFPWPVFILTQVFAVWFNVGVLLATVLRVIGSDLAFGWQSTLKLSAIAVQKAVIFLSWPWSWCVPENIAHPSLAQIEGSRIILKDGITQLSTPDLTAWWPFLCFAVLFYGLVPRLIFLVSAVVIRQKVLKNIRFQSIACDKLLRRLTAPSLDTRGEKSAPPPLHPAAPSSSTATYADHLNRPFVVLVPEDVADSCDDAELNLYVTDILGVGVARKITVSLQMDQDEPLLRPIVPESNGQWVLLLESWQAPIREVLDFIHAIKTLNGPETRLYILLIGKPSNQTIFTPSEAHDLHVWKQKINALGDPGISMESIRDHKGKRP